MPENGFGLEECMSPFESGQDARTSVARASLPAAMLLVSSWISHGTGCPNLRPKKPVGQDREPAIPPAGQAGSGVPTEGRRVSGLAAFEFVPEGDHKPRMEPEAGRLQASDGVVEINETRVGGCEQHAGSSRFSRPQVNPAWSRRAIKLDLRRRRSRNSASCRANDFASSLSLAISRKSRSC